MVGPCDSEIGLNLTPFVLVDEVWIFTFSVGVWEVVFEHTEAAPLSSTGHVALARPATLNVVTPHSEEPLEDLLIPHIGSMNTIATARSALPQESWLLPTGARGSESERTAS